MALAVFNIVCLPFAYFFPETKGRKLEEINLLFTATARLWQPRIRSSEQVTQANGNIVEAERRLRREVNGAAPRADLESREKDFIETDE